MLEMLTQIKKFLYGLNRNQRKNRKRESLVKQYSQFSVLMICHVPNNQIVDQQFFMFFIWLLSFDILFCFQCHQLACVKEKRERERENWISTFHWLFIRHRRTFIRSVEIVERWNRIKNVRGKVKHNRWLFRMNCKIYFFLSFWASLFGCLNDRNICLYGCFCCCCLYGKNIAKMFNQKQWWPYCVRYSISSLFACCCLFHIVSRNQFRERYGLERSFSQDCCITCCCSCCANCQEAREMKIRGSNLVSYYFPWFINKSSIR